MVHINSSYVVPIITLLPTVGVCDMARSFSMILIYIYHITWGKMATLQGICVFGYGLEHPIIDTIVLHFTHTTSREQ